MATTEADTTIRSLELAGFASWPAARVAADGAWQVRLSPHLPYKRTNSINCLDPEDNAGIEPRLARAMAIFAASGVQPTLRVTPLTPPELTEACSRDGWSGPYSESVVMTAPLQSAFNHGAFEGFEVPAPQWIADYMALTMDRTIDATAIAETLSAIEKPVRFLRVAAPDQCLGVAIAVIQGTLVGLFGLAVAKAARRTGIGRTLSHAALAWGADNGARTAWLQVEADNFPARRLYDALGFGERYRYAYRSFNTASDQVGQIE
uniref:GNAT family N-acetyltransferase n=1 Tax=Pararhizobium sp. IMCC3301 TaxID=3067904 RepID=UPI0027426B38|nr:GNAT family N-acetyltransferase [Pararhizobium sp. IMCC3301]